MPDVFTEFNITGVDLFALLFLAAVWVGYVAFAARHGRRVPSLHSRMDIFRREWMVRMIERDNRMVDVNVMRNLTRSSQFFASTTMLILGALIALTGYVQQALDVVSGLPFTVKGTARLLEMKILLLVVIFVYAFFKFAWSYRLFNYGAILIGAVPVLKEGIHDQALAAARRAGAMNVVAGQHFNRGQRAYFFALAYLGWFIHPYVFFASTA
ncbi:MAG TPA: DUF599 domain-containing protein, partial [Burkholderiales bacterium]|nr:DUF599 domain-containing protein [Burkholderiales bacterium]